MLDPMRNKINTINAEFNKRAQARGVQKPMRPILQKPKPDGTPLPGQQMPENMAKPTAPGLQLQPGSPFEMGSVLADKQRMIGNFQPKHPNPGVAEQQENRFVMPEKQGQQPMNPMQQFIQQARAKGYPEQKIMSFLAQKMRGGL